MPGPASGGRFLDRSRAWLHDRREEVQPVQATSAAQPYRPWRADDPRCSGSAFNAQGVAASASDPAGQTVPELAHGPPHWPEQQWAVASPALQRGWRDFDAFVARGGNDTVPPRIGGRTMVKALETAPVTQVDAENAPA